MAEYVHNVIQTAYHRNGVGGAGFHAVIFEHKLDVCSACGASWGWKRGDGFVIGCIEHPADKGGTSKALTIKMLGVVFDARHHVAVFALDKLVNPAVGVAFGDGDDGNSWRGDRFEAELRAAIDNNESDGSVRLGPFGLPTARRTS